MAFRNALRKSVEVTASPVLPLNVGTTVDIVIGVSGGDGCGAGAGDVGGVSGLAMWLKVPESGLGFLVEGSVTLCSVGLSADVELLAAKRPLTRGCSNRRSFLARMRPITGFLCHCGVFGIRIRYRWARGMQNTRRKNAGRKNAGRKTQGGDTGIRCKMGSNVALVTTMEWYCWQTIYASSTVRCM